MKLMARGLPFQAQDQAVGACATTALWSALQPLNEVFGTPLFSPSEITKRSTVFPGEMRAFPSGGLNIEQMIAFVRSLDLDLEVISKLDENIVNTAVRSYIASNIPLIGALKIKKSNEWEGYHAVVISGYKCNSDGDIVQLYVHDDQISPYAEVTPVGVEGSSVIWSTLWGEDHDVKLKKILVPVYHKIRFDFHAACKLYFKLQELLESTNEYRAEIQLTTVQKYKQKLLTMKVKNKVDILSILLPRFLWILSIYEKEKLSWDFIYDGTSVHPSSLLKITYT